MKHGLQFRPLLFTLFFALMSAQLSRAQEPDLPALPAFLQIAGTCLVGIDQNWLGPSTSTAQSARFGWVDDRKSSPGEHHIYLLAQFDADQATLFDIRTERRQDKRILTLENKLQLRGPAPSDEFVNPPAGGPRMVRLYHDAILRIRRRSGYDVQLSRMKERVPNVVCNSEMGE
ncbi:MAG TPA: hypothetical protein VMT82_11615 [candidate division Zixibacteria bacterium]|nr:hypothetical protein [candidate division Zixibacteria bacterium]